MLDREILDDFVTETLELLDEVEPRLIELAQSADTRCVGAETLNAIFRLFHTMKGGASFMGLTTITELTHVAETLLDLFRKGKGAFEAEHVQVLCETIDLVRVMLATVSASGSDSAHEREGEALRQRLRELIANLNDPSHCTDEHVPENTDPEPIILDFGDEPANNEAGDARQDAASPGSFPDANVSGRNDPASPPHAPDQPADAPVLAMTPALRQSFVQEAQEYLEQAELALVNIEKTPEESLGGSLNEAFRALHSLKGNCGFLGFPDMERLAHRMETALAGLRDGSIDASPGKLGLLLKMIDVLKQTVADIAQNGRGEISGHEIYLDLLDDTMGLSPGEQTRPDRPDTATGTDPSRIPVPEPAPQTAARQVPGAPVEALEPTPRRSPAPAPQPDPTPTMKQFSPTTTAPSPGGAPATPSNPPAKAPARQAGEASATSRRPASRTSSGNGPANRQDIRQDIRVDIRKLDALINLVGELVIAEAMVTRHPLMAGIENESLDRATHQLRRVSRDLQDVIMSARMIPLSATFRKMIRLVHDLGKKSGKRINLRLLGEETEVDKTLIEQLADPLVHIVRNAGDHGIEPPGQRAAAGKPEEATITIEGRHEGGEVWILISDDGRGLDRERILGKARENGLVGDEADEWEDQRIFRLIFEPGFSTAEQVTDVSGRGVGMDVVKRNIEKLKGKIDIRGRLGQGSTFILRIPLTLAIIDGMLVRVGSARYTIPLLAIRESLRPEPSWINVTPDGQESVRIRDDFHPILRLHQRFNKEPDSREFTDGILVLVDCDRRTIALFVDEILGQQETVIKGLSDLVGRSPGISGCTILGDGEVSLILDIPGLVEESGESKR